MFPAGYRRAIIGLVSFKSHSLLRLSRLGCTDTYTYLLSLSFSIFFFNVKGEQPISSRREDHKNDEVQN